MHALIEVGRLTGRYCGLVFADEVSIELEAVNNGLVGV